MVTALKIIGIPLYIFGMSLLIMPLFDLELGLSGQVVIVIPLTLIAYWQVFFSKKSEG